MGRPLSKRFFQETTGTSGFQVGCSAWFTGQSGAETSYIVEQTSNSTYIVESDSGPGDRREELTLVQGAPQAEGEMRVQVTPELAAATSEATFTIDTNSSGEVSAVTVTDGGSGYFVNGQFTITDSTLTGGDDAIIAYTVDSETQSINSASVQNGGSGYTVDQTGVAVDTSDIPDPGSTAGVESARIINAHQVKTFEGNRYVWNASGGAGSGGRAGITEATLQEAS